MACSQQVMEENYLQQLYTNPEFSDITIICGHLTIHAHKSVIYVRASYFKKHYGASSAFAHVSHPKIELEEDPAVTEAMIHYIYGFKIDYDEDQSLEDTTKWYFYMQLADAALKYELDGLRIKALQKAQSLLDLIGETKPITEIIDVFRRLPNFTAIDELSNVAMKMPDQRAFLILQDAQFRQFADSYTGDKAWFWCLMEQSHRLYEVYGVLTWCKECHFVWLDRGAADEAVECYRCSKNGNMTVVTGREGSVSSTPAQK